ANPRWWAPAGRSSARGSGLLVQRLDVVPVGVTKEHAVRPVLRPEAGRVLGPCTGPDRGRVEAVDARSVACGEGDVHPPCHRIGPWSLLERERQPGLIREPVLGDAWRPMKGFDPDRAQCGGEDPLTG